MAARLPPCGYIIQRLLHNVFLLFLGSFLLARGPPSLAFRVSSGRGKQGRRFLFLTATQIQIASL
jgi:hypothetical protein